MAAGPVHTPDPNAASGFDPDPQIERIPKGQEEGGEPLAEEDVRDLRRGVEHAQDLLWELYRREDLRCLCRAGGRRRTIRHNPNSTQFHLAFLPGERPEPGIEGCWFCTPTATPNVFDPDSRKRALDGLNLLLRRPRIRRAHDRLQMAVAGGSPGIRYRTPLQTLRELIGRLGWNTLTPQREEHELWAQMRGLLEHLPLWIDGETWRPASQLIWLPDVSLAGGIAEFAHGVDQSFPSATLATEFWMLGLLSEPRLRRVGEFVHMELLDLAGGRHPIRVPASGIRNERDVEGPFLVLAMGTVHPLTGELEVHEAVVEAILRRSAPVPVDSSHERHFFEVLHIRSLPFVRPLGPVDGILDPDALLTDDQVFVEVLGRSDAEYVRRKGRARRRIEHTIATDERRAGWRYLEWAPERGEGLADLLSRLPRRRR